MTLAVFGLIAIAADYAFATIKEAMDKDSMDGILPEGVRVNPVFKRNTCSFFKGDNRCKLLIKAFINARFLTARAKNFSHKQVDSTFWIKRVCQKYSGNQHRYNHKLRANYGKF